MKGTREEVAKALVEISDGIKEISNDILKGCYDKTKWQELSNKMALVSTCLMVQNHEFQENEVL